MEKKEITLSMLIHWLLMAGGCIAAWFIINYLSAVLLPFALAWFFAYLLYPAVKFNERVLHIRVRPVSIILTLIITLLITSGVVMLIIPPMIEQFKTLAHIVSEYLHAKTNIDSFPDAIVEWVYLNENEIEAFLSSKDFLSAVKTAAPGIVEFFNETMSIVTTFTTICITLLYMFFILMDYEFLSSHWVHIFPAKNRPFWNEFASIVEKALSSYFRGQGTVALIMGILFCIGFTIIDFPMAIGLGILIGILDMVPYLHTFALIPTALLALLKAADTGQNFWIIFASAVAVFCIVQIIIDMVVTPKVMGKAMGLNPAILLLSLSVWGALLGFIGLIIALPATTIIVLYWKRYVTHEEIKPTDNNEEDTDSPAASVATGNERAE